MFEKKATVKYSSMRQIRNGVRYITQKRNIGNSAFLKLIVFFLIQNFIMIVKRKSNIVYEVWSLNDGFRGCDVT